MEYVQRAVYGPRHNLSHMMYDRVHLAEYGKTLCGKWVDEMWFVTGDEERKIMVVTCHKCKAISRQIRGKK